MTTGRADGTLLTVPAIRSATDALTTLGATRPELAKTLARLVAAIAAEASKNSRFASALSTAITTEGGAEISKQRRTGRRAPGVIDPFAIYTQSGESGLGDRLRQLEIEELRDIVAEHGMDHDRLAMKWKDPERVVDRIVDKVRARAAKGSAFRPTPSAE